MNTVLLIYMFAIYLYNTHNLKINKYSLTNVNTFFKKNLVCKLSNNDNCIYTGYWETLLSRLNAYMARARLRERHEENLRRKLFKLKQEVRHLFIKVSFHS